MKIILFLQKAAKITLYAVAISEIINFAIEKLTPILNSDGAKNK